LKNEIARLSTDCFVALILDNEVTVGEFVTEPPLPWRRLVQQNGIYRVAAGYPTELTSAQARFEMRNWDEVSLPAIMRGLAELDGGVGCVVFGNNAGQGLPLAQSLAPSLVSERGAIVYAQSLPERSTYEQLGYRTFFRRSETAARLLALAKRAAQPLSLCFVNTIQHNQQNYHDP
jgi:hypothetical protein